MASILNHLPAQIIERLEQNFLANAAKIAADGATIDHWPVVQLLVPTGRAVWLITEFDRENAVFFGLCDLGLGYPELGYVALSELDSLRGALGSMIDFNVFFKATKPLSKYADQARAYGAIEVALA